MPFVQAGDVRLCYENFGRDVPFSFQTGDRVPGQPWKLYRAWAFARRYPVIVYDHRSG